MRVLFVNEGNLGTHIMGQSQLAQALQTGLPLARDVQARFAGLTPMGALAGAAASWPIKPLTSTGLDFRTLRWHLVQSLRARSVVGEELRAWPADAMHVHSQSIALTMRARMRAVPVALSVDTTVRDWWSMPAWSAEQRRHGEITIAPSSALERRAFENAALTLAWSAWARRSIERTAPRARVVEHHPGLDLDRYRPAARRPRERPRVLFVGGRFEAKGGEELLRVLAEELGETVDLDLVTPAPVLERRGVRVHRLGPSDPQLLDLQQQADVLCLPTRADAVPWAILEAMACGTPVLSTRVGGIPDLLDDGRAGLLVGCEDPRALGEGLRALLGDPHARAALATRARERCEQRYDARRQIPRLIEYLRDMVAAAPHAGAPRRSTSWTSAGASARSPNSSAG
ncbi:MAG: glycosyltransferase family 4 protein [Solirubrobacteraceae bacterium]